MTKPLKVITRTRVEWLAALIVFAWALPGCTPATPPSPLEQAELLINRDRLEDARGILNAEIADDASNVAALTLRGVVHERLGDDFAALRDYDTAIAAEPTAAALNNRAAIYGRRGGLPLAIVDLNASLNLDPNQPMALGNRALALIDSGRGGDAIPDLLTIESLAPGQAETARRLGLAYAAAGQMGTAEESLKLALLREPELALAHRDLARHYRTTGRPKLALKAYDNAQRLGPGLRLETEIRDARTDLVVRTALTEFESVTNQPPPFVFQADGRPVMVLRSGRGPATVSASDVDALKTTPSALIAIVRDDAAEDDALRDDAARDGAAANRVQLLNAADIDWNTLTPAAFLLPEPTPQPPSELRTLPEPE